MALWAFYGRVSGIEQATNNSLPTQSEACHARAREKGATEVLDFVDAGVPGDLEWTDRPALSRLLEMAEQDLLAGVVIYDPDRLARDLGVQLAVTEILMKHHVAMEFITQEFNASPEGMLFYQLRGAISQFERAKIRERTQRGKKRVLRAGKPINKITTYGLTYDATQAEWVIMEDQARVVRQIFGWRSQGEGPQQIANRLNADGVKPPRSARWWVTTVRRILANPAYIGRVRLHRWNTEGRNKNRFLPADRRVRPRLRPVEDWIEVRIPPIVDQALWEAVQAAMGEDSRRRAGRQGTSFYLASRLIRCGLCGRPMHGATAHRNRRQTAPDLYYRCNGRYGEPKLGCEMPHLRAAELDDALWTAVRPWLMSSALYAESVRQSQTAGPAIVTGSTETIRSQLAETRGDLHRLAELVRTRVVKESDVRSALRGLREREAALVARLEAPAQRVQAPFDAALPHAFDCPERREYLRGLLAQVVAFPDGRIELTPRTPGRQPNRGLES